MRRAVSLVVPSGRGVLTYYPRPLRPNEDHWLSFPEERPVRLTGARLYFDMYHGFRIVETASELEPYRVTTTRYFYTLLDQNQRELIAYHYHPSGAGWCTYPHIHVGTATGIIDRKAHLATGRLSLEAVIRMLIEDPSIPVTSLRPDWAQVLDMSQRTFEQSRTWA